MVVLGSTSSTSVVNREVVEAELMVEVLLLVGRELLGEFCIALVVVEEMEVLPPPEP